MTEIERFWSKIEMIPFHDCWEWGTGKFADGYGAFHTGKKSNRTNRNMRAHRYMWKITFGPIPKDLQICHKCDNRGCVRPDHLFLGTHDDNHRDKAIKGKMKGSNHSRNKIVESDVLEIRNLAAPGNLSYREIGAKFGIGAAMVGHIVNRRNWIHI